MRRHVFALAFILPFACTQTNKADVLCTAFNGGSVDHAFTGKSFDWHDGHGVLLLNPRGESKRGVVSESRRPQEWTSRFGSATFATDAKGHAVGGMNEAGLVAEVLFLASAKFPESAPQAPAVNELQWVQFVLDNFETIEEVESSLQGTAIEPAFASIHYFVCDKTARCLTIDPVEGRWDLNRLAPGARQVLTNDSRANAEKRIASFQGFGGTRPIPEPGTLPASSPTARYARMAQVLQAGPVAAVDAAFGALNTVRNVNADYPTQWQIVYDQTERHLFFKNVAIKGIEAAPAHLSFRDIDFSCKEYSSALSLETMQNGERLSPFLFGEQEAAALLRQPAQGAPAYTAFQARLAAQPVRTACARVAAIQ